MYLHIKQTLRRKKTITIQRTGCSFLPIAPTNRESCFSGIQSVFSWSEVHCIFQTYELECWADLLRYESGNGRRRALLLSWSRQTGVFLHHHWFCAFLEQANRFFIIIAARFDRCSLLYDALLMVTTSRIPFLNFHSVQHYRFKIVAWDHCWSINSPNRQENMSGCTHFPRRLCYLCRYH